MIARGVGAVSPAGSPVHSCPVAPRTRPALTQGRRRVRDLRPPGGSPGRCLQPGSGTRVALPGACPGRGAQRPLAAHALARDLRRRGTARRGPRAGACCVALAGRGPGRLPQHRSPAVGIRPPGAGRGRRRPVALPGPRRHRQPAAPAAAGAPVGARHRGRGPAARCLVHAGSPHRLRRRPARTADRCAGDAGPRAAGRCVRPRRARGRARASAWSARRPATGRPRAGCRRPLGVTDGVTDAVAVPRRPAPAAGGPARGAGRRSGPPPGHGLGGHPPRCRVRRVGGAHDPGAVGRRPAPAQLVERAGLAPPALHRRRRLPPRRGDGGAGPPADGRSNSRDHGARTTDGGTGVVTAP